MGGDGRGRGGPRKPTTSSNGKETEEMWLTKGWRAANDRKLQRNECERRGKLSGEKVRRKGEKSRIASSKKRKDAVCIRFLATVGASAEHHHCSARSPGQLIHLSHQMLICLLHSAPVCVMTCRSLSRRQKDSSLLLLLPD